MQELVLPAARSGFLDDDVEDGAKSGGTTHGPMPELTWRVRSPQATPATNPIASARTTDALWDTSPAVIAEHVVACHGHGSIIEGTRPCRTGRDGM